MTATKPATTAVYQDRAGLERGVMRLKERGFRPEEISVFIPHGEAEPAPAVPAGAEIGAGAGALLGGVLGFLIGVGMLAVPGVGALVIAGPLGTALAGSTAFAGIGGIVGSFVGLGATDENAKQYETYLKRGQPMVFVQCEDHQRSAIAQQVLTESGAENVFSTEFNSFPPPHGG